MTSTRSWLAAVAAAAATVTGLFVLPAQAADPGVQVLSSTGYADSIGYYHVVGEVQNGGTAAVQFVKVDVSYFDAANALLSKASGNASVDELAPGEKSPFEVLTNAPAGFDHYTVTSATGFAATTAPNHYFTVSVSSDYTDSSGVPHVAGTVRNDNTTSASSVQVVGTLLDAAGKVTDLATAYAVPGTIPAGGSATFDLAGHAARPFTGQRLVAQSMTAPSPGASSSPTPAPTSSPTPTPAPTSSPTTGAGPAPRGTANACPAGKVAAGTFSDVPAGGVHSADIGCVVWWQVANGQTASTYGPSGAVRRDQMASFIARLVRDSGGTLPAGAPDAFGDDNGDSHQADINALAAAGIVKGSGGGFNPGGTVTRGAMAAFLVRAYDYRAATTLGHTRSYFTDDDGSTFASDIDTAAEAGFAGGYADGTYRPAGVVTRDQMATFLARVLDLLVARGLASPPSA